MPLLPSPAPPERSASSTITQILDAADVPKSLDRLQQFEASPASRLECLVAERDRYQLMLDVVMQLPGSRDAVAAALAASDATGGSLRGGVLFNLRQWPVRDIDAEIARYHALDVAPHGQ